MEELKYSKKEELFQSFLGEVFLYLNRVTGRSGLRFMSKIVSREHGIMYSRTLRLFLERQHKITLGSYSYGDFRDLIRFPVKTTIGRYTSIGPGVRAFAANHPFDFISMHPFFFRTDFGYVEKERIKRNKLEIGHDVWIGCNVIICPGCHRIGNGAVIGAGSIVTKDVCDFAVVAGNPAKKIKMRFDETLIQKINQLGWWNYSIKFLETLDGEFTKKITYNNINQLFEKFTSLKTKS